jgi:Fanconi anemia group M protein
MYVIHPLIRENKIEHRTYQKAIAETAIAKNTLVVAPTALGKTVIAVLVAAHYLMKHPRKKVLILAPTRPLAAQHAKRFIEFLTLGSSKVVLLTGHTHPEKRKEVWNSSRIICATPQVVRNDFILGRYEATDISLAVFDEAHRAVGDYPYPFIASQIEGRILALTASPGGNVETIQGVCNNLRIEGIELRGEDDPDTAPYVKGSEIEWKRVKLPEPYWVVRNLLLGLLRERLKVLKNHGVLKSFGTDITKKELLSIMSELQKKVASKARKDLYPAVSAVSASLTIAHGLALLETQGLTSLSSYLKRTETKANSPSASKALKKLSLNHDFKRVVAMSNTLKDKYKDPKLEVLRVEISQALVDTRIIVFTQYRDSAGEIVKALNKMEGVKAVRFVGQASKNGDKGLSQKEQLAILEDFRSGVYNVLVATSVGEEGLDIPSVDLVIFFEPISSEIRTIQRRGRTGRTSMGRVVILIAEKTRDEGIYWSSVSKERSMKKSLKGFKTKSPKSIDTKISDWVWEGHI